MLVSAFVYSILFGPSNLLYCPLSIFKPVNDIFEPSFWKDIKPLERFIRPAKGTVHRIPRNPKHGARLDMVPDPFDLNLPRPLEHVVDL